MKRGNPTIKRVNFPTGDHSHCISMQKVSISGVVTPRIVAMSYNTARGELFLVDSNNKVVRTILLHDPGDHQNSVIGKLSGFFSMVTFGSVLFSSQMA